MPGRKARYRKQQRRSILLPVLIVIAVIALAVVGLRVLREFNSIGSPEPQATTIPVAIDPNAYVDQRENTPEPLVLGGTPTPEPTAEPTQAPMGIMPVESIEPVVEEVSALPENRVGGAGMKLKQAADEAGVSATAEPEGPDLSRLSPTPQPGDYFLPVFDRALRTQDDDLAIALTIDCCNVSDVMQEYVSTARFYGAKLTLFPTGEAIMSPKMSKAFVSCARTMGYEIENFSYNKKPEFNLTNAELVLQLWRQNISLSYVMGADYEQHFYRPLNVGSVGDQRTHYLLRRLGFKGMASYTYNYDGNSAETLIASLANGNIYRFDMSQNSLKKFKALIAAATAKGYKCVTMNALFGFNEKVISDRLTLDTQEMPTMDGYTATYYDLKLNTRSYAVIALQYRLYNLGYIEKDPAAKRYVADGLYGASTSEAVSRFQAKVGLPATGTADPATQEILFSNNAPSV